MQTLCQDRVTWQGLVCGEGIAVAEGWEMGEPKHLPGRPPCSASGLLGEGCGGAAD